MRVASPPKWSIEPVGTRFDAGFVMVSKDNDPVLQNGIAEFKQANDKVTGYLLDSGGQNISIELTRNSSNVYIHYQNDGSFIYLYSCYDYAR